MKQAASSLAFNGLQAVISQMRELTAHNHRCENARSYIFTMNVGKQNYALATKLASEQHKQMRNGNFNFYNR
jgi:hypothetical protein